MPHIRKAELIEGAVHRVDWFELHEGRYAALPAAAVGRIVRSRVFPGLWLAVA